jgi:hypothetical protein
LDLKTPFTTDDIAKTATQLTQIESARGRNITMIMTIKTTHCQLNKIKYPMLAWLQKENYWFERHLFKTTQIDICHLGFLVGKCPTDTHRATLQKTINDKIATLTMGQATDDYLPGYALHASRNPNPSPSRVSGVVPSYPIQYTTSSNYGSAAFPPAVETTSRSHRICGKLTGGEAPRVQIARRYRSLLLSRTCTAEANITWHNREPPSDDDNPTSDSSCSSDH